MGFVVVPANASLELLRNMAYATVLTRIASHLKTSQRRAKWQPVI